MFDIRTIPGAEKLNAAFAAGGFEIRLVGGAVRDILLDETPKDFDFATDATPAEMREVAGKAGFGCIATGEQHGTMTIVVDGEPFEVTTLRIDVETDGRRAEVEFTRCFEEDAARRDLTFNAMSMCFDGKLYDYFDGQKDLRERKVRFVGVARQRVEEDYLRILRYFRFAARFRANADRDALEMLFDPAIHEGLRKISVERYWLEMGKLFMAPDAPRILLLMEGLNVLKTIGLPGDVNAHRLMNADDPASKLATFMPPDFTAKDAEAWCRDWKLSTDVIDKVAFLVKMRDFWVSEHMVEDLLVDGTPRDYVVSWVKTMGHDPEWAETFVPPVFPVNGQDLMGQGMKPGPDMGRKLKDLREAWKRSRFQLTKEELLAEGA